MKRQFVLRADAFLMTFNKFAYFCTNKLDMSN